MVKMKIKLTLIIPEIKFRQVNCTAYILFNIYKFIVNEQLNTFSYISDNYKQLYFWNGSERITLQ